MSDIKYAKYTVGSGYEDEVYKDGHKMFTLDIVKDLNRKSYLESELCNLKAENERLKKLVDFIEGRYCDCSDFDDYGVHGKNCYITDLRKGLDGSNEQKHG